MNPVSIPAHYDGKHIVLDEPYPLAPETRLITTVLADSEERADWLSLSAQRLAAAYSDDEPEYLLMSVLEENPSRSTLDTPTVR
jgi:hypothetical protein